MKTSHHTLISAVDRLEMSGLLIAPDTAPKAVVQICHGMAEYKERYIPFMTYLAEQGFACFIHDHRGHGKSVKSEDDLGYMGVDDGAEALVEDANLWTAWLHDRFPGLKITLIGHSMGSLIVRSYLQKYDGEIDALVVSGCVAENPACGIALGLVGTLKAFKGDRHRSKFITNMAFGSYNKNFPDAVSPNAWLNTDEAAVAAYDADPLCGFTFTLNGYKALFNLVLGTYKAKRYGMAHKDLPIFFASGSDDPCMTDRAHFDRAVAFMKDLGYKNTSSRLFEGMRHEILNEPGRAEVYECILEHLAQ